MPVEPNIRVRLEMGDFESREYGFDNGLVTIGRKSDRDLVLPPLHVSRIHACIYLNENGLHVLKDGDLLGTKSKNGVYLNGDRVINETRFFCGDVITFSSDFPRIVITSLREQPHEEVTAIYKN